MLHLSDFFETFLSFKFFITAFITVFPDSFPQAMSQVPCLHEHLTSSCNCQIADCYNPRYSSNNLQKSAASFLPFISQKIRKSGSVPEKRTEIHPPSFK